MLANIDNKDIAETLSQREGSNLEDQIFEAIDKVQALCAVQSQVEAGEGTLADATRIHYSMILDEQARQLRSLLERHFR